MPDSSECKARNDTGLDKVKKTTNTWREQRIKALEKLNHLRYYLWREVGNAVENGGDDGEYVTEAEQDEHQHEIEQLLNMTRIPLFLERFMLWTLLACFDCFLHFFTVMPMKILHGFVSRYRKGKEFPLSRTSNERFMAFLIIVASAILSKLDTSKAYHRIKRQSSVKLYMLFGVLEMADKMLASMGQSLFTVLLSRTSSQRALYTQAILSSLTVTYLVSHGYVLVYQTVALNVAVNSYSNALLTLLLSMQFTEIKASLFKKFDKEGLFQLTIADVVERYQLILLLMIIALRNVVAKSNSQSNVIPNSWTLHATSSVVIGVLCGPMLNVLGSELIVDWVKHAYVTKFNRIRPRIYDKFLFIMCEDHATSLHKFGDRLGLPIPALVVLFIVMMLPTLFQVVSASSASSLVLTILILALGFACLVIVKISLHILLIKLGKIILNKGNTTTAVTENEYVPGNLSSGSGKVDIRVRSIIHYDSKNDNSSTRHKQEDVGTKRASTSPLPNKEYSEEMASNTSGVRSLVELPPNLNEIRRRRNLKNPTSLENVARYKMVSKRIW